MEAKMIEQKWTAEAMNKIMANQISQDLSCEVHVETEPKPEKGQKVKATLYYGDRKRPVGTDIVTEGGHAFFRNITVKLCGEYPEEGKFRVKFETILKPEEPKPEDKKKPTVDPVKDKEPKKDVGGGKDDDKGKRKGKEDRKPTGEKPTAPTPAPTRKRHIAQRSLGPDGARGSRVVYLIYEADEGTGKNPVPVQNDAIIFADPADRLEAVSCNAHGLVVQTFPFVWTREVQASLASSPSESTFFTVN